VESHFTSGKVLLPVSHEQPKLLILVHVYVIGHGVTRLSPTIPLHLSVLCEGHIPHPKRSISNLTQRGDASRDFVHLGLDEMPDVAEKKNKEREKRQRKRAKQKQKKQDAKLQAEQDVLEQDQLAQEERRKGKIQVGADLGAALTRLAMDAKPSFT